MPCSPQSMGRASVSGSGREEAMQGPGLDHHCSAPCLSDPGKKPCRAQLEVVLEGLGCPPKPGDPVQRGAKALVQAPARNPWPAPPA